jgi:hypothetical protein
MCLTLHQYFHSYMYFKDDLIYSPGYIRLQLPCNLSHLTNYHMEVVLMIATSCDIFSRIRSPL